jgi:hypothetical protein
MNVRMVKSWMCEWERRLMLECWNESLEGLEGLGCLESLEFRVGV